MCRAQRNKQKPSKGMRESFKFMVVVTQFDLALGTPRLTEMH